MSVEDLAQKLGKNRATVYRYENGDIRNLPSEVLVPLAAALDTTPGELLVGTEPRNESHQDEMTRRLLKYMTLLNDAGQEAALSRIEELTELSKYRKG